jgi:LPXTG-motif cell wall-anchored protein
LIDAYQQTATGTYTPGPVPTTVPNLPATGIDYRGMTTNALISLGLGSIIIVARRRRKHIV